MTTYNTGNPIGSTDARDRLDNSENMDILENSTTLNAYPDRLGVMRKTRKGMELEHDNQITAHEVEHDAQVSAHEAEHDNQMQSFENDFDSRLAGMAFTRVGTFTAGYTLTDARQVLLYETDGHEYGWTGAFPKVVPPASTPAGTGGIGAGAWVDRTDSTLRSELNVIQKRFTSVSSMLGDTSTLIGASISTGGTVWKFIGGDHSNISNYTPITKANALDWGVVADYPNTNTTTELVQAITDCKTLGCELFIPNINSGYLLSGEGVVDFRNLKCEVQGKLRFGADTTGYIVIGGNSASKYNPKQTFSYVGADTARTIDAPCIKIKGSKSQDISIGSADSVWLHAENSDVATNYSIGYNIFRFGYVPYIWLYGEDKGVSSSGGWVNENTFHLARCSRVNIGTSTGDSYTHNNNRFYGGAFENTATHINVKNGRDNTFYDVRLESAGADSLIFEADSINTRIFLSWNSSQTSEPAYQVKYTDLGRGNIVAGNDDAVYATYPICNLTAETVKLDNDTYPKDCAIYEVGGWDGTSVTAVRTARDIAVKKLDGRLAINVNNATVYKSGFIPVSQTGDTRILVSTAGWEETTGKGYRFELYGFDTNLTQITATAADMYVNGRGLVGFGNVTTTGRRVGDVVNILNASAKYVVMVLRVTGTVGDKFDFIRAVLRTPKVAVNTNGTTLQAAHFAFSGMTPSLPRSRLTTSISTVNNVASSISFAVRNMSAFTLHAAVSTTSVNGYQYFSINSVGDGAGDWVETVVTNIAGDGGSLDLTLTSMDATNKIAYFTLSKPAGVATTSVKLSLIVDCPDGVWLTQ